MWRCGSWREDRIFEDMKNNLDNLDNICRIIRHRSLLADRVACWRYDS